MSELWQPQMQATNNLQQLNEAAMLVVMLLNEMQGMLGVCHMPILVCMLACECPVLTPGRLETHGCSAVSMRTSH